jgi:EpsI family protein
MTSAALRPRYLIVGLAMLAAAGLAAAMRPDARLSDTAPKVDLEAMIPGDFAGWKIDNTLRPLVADPVQQEVLDRTYDQTLARTYLHDSGARMMLSIAYGGDQRDGLAIHRPEVCYPAQGFGIQKSLLANLGTAFGELPVKRLVAVNGLRVEPITYWITVGDRIARSGPEQKMAQLRWALTGKVPDGFLVRVSSLSADSTSAYEQQAQFLNALLAALSPDDRDRLIGAYEFR